MREPRHDAGGTLAALAAQVPAVAAAQRQLTGYRAQRARLVDGWVAEAVAAGVRQCVVLAGDAGPRLPDASGLTVYRVDWPGTWARTLWKAGFNHNQPTMWLVEGLLPLPGAAQDAVISGIDGLSAAGSRLAVDDPVGRCAGRSHPADWLTSRGWWTDVVELPALFSTAADVVIAEKVA